VGLQCHIQSLEDFQKTLGSLRFTNLKQKQKPKQKPKQNPKQNPKQKPKQKQNPKQNLNKTQSQT
jgi:hypothetical protein